MSFCVVQDPEQIRAYEQRIINLAIDLACVKALLVEAVVLLDVYCDYKSSTLTRFENMHNARSFLFKPEVKALLDKGEK